MSKNAIKLWGLLFILALLGIGSWIFYSSFLEKKNFPQNKGFPVEVAKVQVLSFPRLLKAVGTLQANESVILRPETQGKITDILFDEGHTVEQGVKLIQLENSVEEADLKDAQAKFALAQVEYQRILQLYKKALVSSEDRDTSLSKLQASEALVQKMQTKLDQTTLTAPFSGLIGLRKISKGDLVQPGQELVTLVSIDPIKVEFHLPEKWLTQVEANQPIETRTEAHPKKTFSGKIYAIEPGVNPIVHDLTIRGLLPNSEKLLRPGLFVTVTITLEKERESLYIPEESLVPQGSKQFVYRVIDNKATLTEVTLGERQGKLVEILQGLSREDIVISAGQSKIRPDMPVIPINFPMPEEKAP